MDTRGKIKNIVGHLHEVLDKAVGEIQNCCIEGCDHCCYQSIEVLLWEQPLIEDYVKQNIHGEDLNRIKKNHEDWLSFFHANTPNKEILNVKEVFVDFMNVVDSNNLPCPFLHENKCSIYPVRPLSCRSHFMLDSPQKCKEDKLREACLASKAIRARGVNVLADIADMYVVPLAYACSEMFELTDKIKKIDNISFRMPEY
ncbi:hypothetical protein GCQ56_07760 [Marinifilum sp. N1E240]|uniref:YkgJ family cysteine cluster protein n=1 Tax=Marinifilum sp. N1E240 TaxID=2608082 RepID=UPI00128C28BA|nr:YkgJ family cysteine cluster protein [Marinifilum sp. N1E240]MPQ46909.1 hypothetical protein [Marinifilum sp. N1E240]